MSRVSAALLWLEMNIALNDRQGEQTRPSQSGCLTAPCRGEKGYPSPKPREDAHDVVAVGMLRNVEHYCCHFLCHDREFIKNALPSKPKLRYGVLKIKVAAKSPTRFPLKADEDTKL